MFILKGIGGVIPHGVDGTFRADPFTEDILTIEIAREGAGVGFPDLRGEGQIVIHGEMEAVEADFPGTVDEIRFDKMVGSVGVAIHEDFAAGHGAAADHLVDEGPGEEGGLVGIGAGGGHALELVLGVVLVRAEEVVGVASY